MRELARASDCRLQLDDQIVRWRSLKIVVVVASTQRICSNISSLILYVLAARLRLSPLFGRVAVALAAFFGGTVNLFIRRSLLVATKPLLTAEMLTTLVDLLEGVVFNDEAAAAAATPTSGSEEAKRKTTDAKHAESLLLERYKAPALLKRFAASTAKNYDATTSRIFECFQHAPLNRQLAFVLVDAIAEQILGIDDPHI